MEILCKKVRLDLRKRFKLYIGLWKKENMQKLRDLLGYDNVTTPAPLTENYELNHQIPVLSINNLI